MVAILISAWAGGLVFAGTALEKESRTPGAVGRVPVLWPLTAQGARRSTSRPTLVLALHPQCGCSAATVAELGKLVAQFPDRLNIQVLVRQPVGETWSPSAREITLSAMPGVTLVQDHGGVEAERFGALTSGQVILFDTKGRKVFAGGLTAVRGHEGPSAGSFAIASFLRLGLKSDQIPDSKSGATALATSSVFGCALAEVHQ